MKENLYFVFCANFITLRFLKKIVHRDVLFIFLHLHDIKEKTASHPNLSSEFSSSWSEQTSVFSPTFLSYFVFLH